MSEAVSLYTEKPEYFGDLCEEIRIFLPVRHIEQAETATVPAFGWFVAHRFTEGEGGAATNEVAVYSEGRELASELAQTVLPPASDALAYKKYAKRAAKNAVFAALGRCVAADTPWGSLTGVRPTKLFRESEAELGAEGAELLFTEEFHVRADKAALAREITEAQRPFLAAEDDGPVDLYVGIPFCPTKCAYCSFSSSVLSKKGDAERDYAAALAIEAELCRSMTQRAGIHSIYIGGGTPTALPAAELDCILSALPECAGEYTVEAGRPDSITAASLAILREHGVSRISVNAQTTSDETLRRIGRAHTAADFFRAFDTARAAGFDDINTDIIIGLPGETERDVERTIADVISMRPSNITVHTLAIKRASRFAEEEALLLPDAQTAERMLALCDGAVRTAGYAPYYMYRQKYMAGNLENTGYALSGRVCGYNIDIMEETRSILALGAGGISKRLWRAQNRIERAANVKDIGQYCRRVREMAERKLALFSE